VITGRGNLGLQDFSKQVAALGRLHGRNLQIDVHWGGSIFDYIHGTAAELARSKPDVIVPYATRVLFCRTPRAQTKAAHDLFISC
jgi:hypothetical protein